MGPRQMLNLSGPRTLETIPRRGNSMALCLPLGVLGRIAPPYHETSETIQPGARFIALTGGTNWPFTQILGLVSSSDGK